MLLDRKLSQCYVPPVIFLVLSFSRTILFLRKHECLNLVKICCLAISRVNVDLPV